MFSLIKKIYSFLLHRKYKELVCIGDNVYFGPRAEILQLWGSTKSDISIGSKSRIYGRLISQSNGKIEVGLDVKVGPGVTIGAVNSIVIGDGTILSNNIVIMDNNNHPLHPKDREIMHSSPVGDDKRSWKHSVSSPIIIGNNVWVGQQVRICKGVKIGDGSIIAANSVVTKNVPSNSVVAGNPAKVVKEDLNDAERVWD
ncbi:acyltransferase [Vibrio alginolyticus]